MLWHDGWGRCFLELLTICIGNPREKQQSKERYRFHECLPWIVRSTSPQYSCWLSGTHEDGRICKKCQRFPGPKIWERGPDRVCARERRTPPGGRGGLRRHGRGKASEDQGPAFLPSENGNDVAPRLVCQPIPRIPLRKALARFLRSTSCHHLPRLMNRRIQAHRKLVG